MSKTPNFKWEMQEAWNSGEDEIAKHANGTGCLTTQINTRRQQIEQVVRGIATCSDEVSRKVARRVAKQAALGDWTQANKAFYAGVVIALERRYPNAGIAAKLQQLGVPVPELA